jgi:cell division septation protein DedD
MSWIRNTVAVAAAIVAFFFMSTPVVNSDLGTRTMSHLQNNILYRLMPKDSNVIPAQPIVKTTIAQDADSVKSGLSSKSSVSSKSSNPSESKRYLVIVASQVKLSNAEAYVEKLHKQGYEDAKVFISNNVVRVSCGEYETEAEAYRRANRLSNKEEFYDAWVYKHSI